MALPCAPASIWWAVFEDMSEMAIAISTAELYTPEELKPTS